MRSHTPGDVHGEVLFGDRHHTPVKVLEALRRRLHQFLVRQ